MSTESEQGPGRERQGMGRITIIVNNQPLHLADSVVEPSRLRDFADAPDEYEIWKVVGSPDPEGQLPVDDIQVTGPVKVKSGERFRVVPPGTFGKAG